MELEIEYLESECGGLGCTPNGCPGHRTDIPVAIILNGFRLVQPEVDRGEPLGEDDKTSAKEYERWKKTIENLQALFKLTDHEQCYLS